MIRLIVVVVVLNLYTVTFDDIFILIEDEDEDEFIWYFTILNVITRFVPSHCLFWFIDDFFLS